MVICISNITRWPMTLSTLKHTCPCACISTGFVRIVVIQTYTCRKCTKWAPRIGIHDTILLLVDLIKIREMDLVNFGVFLPSFPTVLTFFSETNVQCFLKGKFNIWGFWGCCLYQEKNIPVWWYLPLGQLWTYWRF